jgi:hypothetical protein
LQGDNRGDGKTALRRIGATLTLAS